MIEKELSLRSAANVGVRW